MIVDTHAHLYWESFKEDFDQIIQRALDAGVSTIINVGVDVEKSQLAVEQIEDLKKFKSLQVFSTIGIHPHEAVKYSSNSDVSIHQDISRVEEIYQKNISKVVAVGECGLDFLFESNSDWIPSSLSIDEVKDLQRKLFKAQIDLAKKLNLPLIVHCRDDKRSLRSDDLRSKDPQNTECWDETIDLTYDHFGIYHCYSGLPQTTKRILEETKFLISFAGNLTYPKNEYLRETVKTIPLERIVVETDCPFLPPQKYRGQRNEPSFIKEVVQTVAELKGLPIEKIEQAIFQNSQILYN